MKVVVSYISSLYDREETIKKICATSADGVHADLMDGKYVEVLNFDLDNPTKYIDKSTKPLDIHLMVDSPHIYLDRLYTLNPICIYIHPSTEANPIKVLEDITTHGVMAAIAINPDEEILKYEYLYPYVKRVLLMSVTPGYGGQKFMDITTDRLQELKNYQEEYNFEIFIDGGINEETISKVKDADGVVSGSFICKSEDYEKRIRVLR